jgi:hypothetical protein
LACNLLFLFHSHRQNPLSLTKSSIADPHHGAGR